MGSAKGELHPEHWGVSGRPQAGAAGVDLSVGLSSRHICRISAPILPASVPDALGEEGGVSRAQSSPNFAAMQGVSRVQRHLLLFQPIDGEWGGRGKLTILLIQRP